MIITLYNVEELIKRGLKVMGVSRNKKFLLKEKFRPNMTNSLPPCFYQVKLPNFTPFKVMEEIRIGNSSTQSISSTKTNLNSYQTRITDFFTDGNKKPQNVLHLNPQSYFFIIFIIFILFLFYFYYFYFIFIIFLLFLLFLFYFYYF